MHYDAISTERHWVVSGDLYGFRNCYSIRRSWEYNRCGANDVGYRLYSRIDMPDDLGWYGKELRDVEGRASRAEIVVAEVDEQIAGSLAYHDDYSDEVKAGQLDNYAGFRVLATDPQFQGRGVGEALTRWCIDRAKRDGRDALVLNTTDYGLRIVLP